MNAPLIFLAPLALLVPPLGAGPVAPGEAKLIPRTDTVGAPIERSDPGADPVAAQVRIEQRVVIRIAPRDPAMRNSLFAEMAPLPVPPRVNERKMGKCVPVGGIAAVQPDAGGRLLLYMRDQRLISASLEKACSARDFYSGFYLERTGDGMLCVERDKLHSRAGASCEIRRMRQLVATED